MEQFENIRRDRRDNEMSIRQLAQKYKVHRRTIRQALADAVPPPRKVPARVAPVLGAHVATVRGWLVADKEVPRRQRHTARRVWQRLVEEEGVDVAESSVRTLVAELRRDIFDQSLDVKVPQTHAPAEEAEVDFGEFNALIGGVWLKLWMFILRLSHSGKAVHIAYANQAQESFLDGHVQAFDRLGGVPTGMIRYDNLTPAVVRVLLGRGRGRDENPRFIGLRSHYGFDSFFCQPGIEGAHEKGGVEGEVGRFRRRHLVPVPEFASLAELNAFMAAADAGDDDRKITGRIETVGAAAARELPGLRGLPDDAFDATQTLSCRVDARARVCVRQSYYSVPARYAGRRVQVRLGATAVTAVAEGAVIAVHTRSLHKYTEDLVLDHYLEVLSRKPGALAGATALTKARRAGAFTEAHQRFWDGARRQLGDAAGTRALIGVLLLNRSLPVGDIATGITVATGLGRFDADLVAVEARRAGQAITPPPAVVVPAHAGPARDRPVPGLGAYDELVGVVGSMNAETAPASTPAVTALGDQAAEAAITTACRSLFMPTIRDQAGVLAEAAARERLSHKAYLAEVLAAECDDRDARRRIRRIKEAKFPRTKHLADFDPTVIEDLPPARLATLATGAWIDAGEPLVLLGDSGTGKTHLLIGLGTAAAEQGRRVRYVTTAALVNELTEAADSKQLSRVVGRYARLDLLCLDELGYVSLDSRGAELLFQIITEREERASIATASNASFSQWGATFADPRLAAAVVDRLTFNAHIINTGTSSYRLRTTRAREATVTT